MSSEMRGGYETKCLAQWCQFRYYLGGEAKSSVVCLLFPGTLGLPWSGNPSSLISTQCRSRGHQELRSSQTPLCYTMEKQTLNAPGLNTILLCRRETESDFNGLLTLQPE